MRLKTILHDISKSWGRIWMKLGGQVGCVTSTNWFDFGEDLKIDPDSRIFQWFFIRDRAKYHRLSLKVVVDLWQNEVEELVRWQEQADLILVKVWNHIRPISGIQNVNYRARWRYVISGVPFGFAKLSLWVIFHLFVRTELSCFSLQPLVGLR